MSKTIEVKLDESELFGLKSLLRETLKVIQTDKNMELMIDGDQLEEVKEFYKILLKKIIDKEKELKNGT